MPRKFPPQPLVLDLPEEVERGRPVGLNDFQKVTSLTDRLPPGLEPPIMGLFGEVGSLISELKKKLRDRAAYVEYDDGVLEELGDVLWYFTTISRRAGLDLSVLAQQSSRRLNDWDEVVSYDLATFADLDRQGTSVADDKFEEQLVALAGKMGELVTDLLLGRFHDNRDRLSSHMVEVLRSVASVAEAGDVSLDEAAWGNLIKTFSRWPLSENYPDLEAGVSEPDERFPRKFEMELREIISDEKIKVQLSLNGSRVGDRLTDNKSQPDDYRFHDVFHIAHVVFLGWSPVLRSLLKLKRRKNPSVDENQDGGRAALIEEGVATFVFGRALERRFFRSLETLDFDTLKLVSEFVRGYEVEKCALWQWEKAILQGYKVFRQIRSERGGIVVADLDAHTLRFKSTKSQR